MPQQRGNRGYCIEQKQSDGTAFLFIGVALPNSISVLQLLDVGSATLMLDMVEIGKVGTTLLVVLENSCCLNTLDAISLKVRCHLVEYK